MAKYVKTEEGYKKYQEVEAINSNKMDKANPTGTGSFSLNRKSGTIVGISSFAEGYDTTASGKYSHSEGRNTTASNAGSHAEGYSTTASGSYSHAEGESTTASSPSSHSEGRNTTASNAGSHAEGYSTTASGAVSHAEGLSTNKFSSVVTATNPTNDAIITAWKRRKFSLAKGDSSHVEGKDSLALGHYSHAEGNLTTASGEDSHAEGLSTTASSNRQHVQGKCNIADSSNTYADIIGNGTSDTARSNAATVDWSGNAWYAGDVYVGSTSGTNKDAGSKKLATEEYVSTALGNYIPDPSLGITGATVGQIAKITAVDSDGKPTAWEPVDMPSGGSGLTAAQISALNGMFKVTAFSADPVAAYDAFKAAFGIEGSESESVPATAIVLDKTTMSFADATTKTISATVTPANSTDPVSWNTSDPAIATVSGGVVTPVADGSCTITATAGSVSASCEVTVSISAAPPASGVEWEVGGIDPQGTLNTNTARLRTTGLIPREYDSVSANDGYELIVCCFAEDGTNSTKQVYFNPNDNTVGSTGVYSSGPIDLAGIKAGTIGLSSKYSWFKILLRRTDNGTMATSEGATAVVFS